MELITYNRFREDDRRSGNAYIILYVTQILGYKTHLILMTELNTTAFKEITRNWNKKISDISFSVFMLLNLPNNLFT